MVSNSESIKTLQIEPSNTNKNHVCKDCNRSFSSGKALGGHMSSAHVQTQADKDLSLKKLKSKKKDNGSDFGILCNICGRGFRSSKSLFGHMKCHPDRHWRGMVPPDEKPEDLFDHEDLIYLDVDEEKSEEENIDSLGPVMDLSLSLTGWGAKGKRGRPEPGSEPDEDLNELHAAVYQLIRLVSDPVAKKVEERQVVAENQPCGPGPDNMVVCDNVAPMEKATSISEGDGIDSKAKRAKVDKSITGTDEKLRSPPIRENVSESSVSPTQTSTPGKLFICKTCKKSFSSYQALGGHRSSHNQPKVNIFNTIDEVDTNIFGSSSKAKTAIARGHAKLFGSSKDVSNGQVLGGHDKCQGTNLVDMLPSNDQATTENGSTQVNVVDRVPYNDQATFEFGSTQGSSVDMVPFGSQATFENGSTQGSTVDRVSSGEQATSADVRTQTPKPIVLLDLNEFPDEDEI